MGRAVELYSRLADGERPWMRAGEAFQAHRVRDRLSHAGASGGADRAEA
ncbi:hypothetical protein ACFFGH_08120 [Lysobacter korlensis]|uniref:Uncharacterized protein n=1 Tax=Lysobacter korlensis TaxID=553636 RepID=A0ABV6RN47_9GAMM